MSAPFLKSVIVGNPREARSVFPRAQREKIASKTELHPIDLNETNIKTNWQALEEADIIFATWGMPAFSEMELKRLTKLKAVFYAAGSVKLFGEPLLKKGIILSSAWQANAIPVAEFTLATILLAMKGFYRNSREYIHPEAFHSAYRGPGNFGETVSLLGAGAIGRKLIELLRPFRLQVQVFDPYLSDEGAKKLGVVKVSLEAAFENGFVVSNHLANIPATVRMLRGNHFEKLRHNAVFINTGRGATVNESEFLDVFERRQDLTALLDVTYPEPPVHGSPFYTLPNVVMTTHIAGSQGDEVVRMAAYAWDEFLAWHHGEPLRYQVTLDMLPSMA